MSWC